MSREDIHRTVTEAENSLSTQEYMTESNLHQQLGEFLRALRDLASKPMNDYLIVNLAALNAYLSSYLTRIERMLPEVQNLVNDIYLLFRQFNLPDFGFFRTPEVEARSCERRAQQAIDELRLQGVTDLDQIFIRLINEKRFNEREAFEAVNRDRAAQLELMGDSGQPIWTPMVRQVPKPVSQPVPHVEPPLRSEPVPSPMPALRSEPVLPHVEPSAPMLRSEPVLPPPAYVPRQPSVPSAELPRQVSAPRSELPRQVSAPRSELPRQVSTPEDRPPLEFTMRDEVHLPPIQPRPTEDILRQAEEEELRLIEEEKRLLQMEEERLQRYEEAELPSFFLHTPPPPPPQEDRTRLRSEEEVSYQLRSPPEPAEEEEDEESYADVEEERSLFGDIDDASY